jgi:hypothetical protein
MKENKCTLSVSAYEKSAAFICVRSEDEVCRHQRKKCDGNEFTKCIVKKAKEEAAKEYIGHLMAAKVELETEIELIKNELHKG